MQFRITFETPVHDLPAIESALRAIDPAATIDLVGAGRLLRVASTLDSPQLEDLLGRTGHRIDPAQLFVVPSECCGGCGG